MSKDAGLGLWIVGACGGVGCTVALGLAALRRGLAGTQGMVSALRPFGEVGLADPADIAFGGHEIRTESLLEAVSGLRRRSNVFDDGLVKSCTPDLRRFQRNIRPGTLCGASAPIRTMADTAAMPRDRSGWAAVERLAADIREFREKQGLACVVVVYLASSERPLRGSNAFRSPRRLQELLRRRGNSAAPPSAMYALAAVEAGCPFVNFTPSPGLNLPAVRERALQRGLPFMGNDGKTGETLVKSALAPMFAARNLDVLTWFGQNILGNRDGAVLDDPAVRASKLRSKDKTVAPIVGGTPTTKVGIEYLPSLDDWKVAWDFVHFRGFLDTKMSMQFVWQGSDSLLAAPLVIDLARFAEYEFRAGRAGPMRHLACFFKDPIDVAERDLFTQWQQLVGHFSGPRPTSEKPGYGQ